MKQLESITITGVGNVSSGNYKEINITGTANFQGEITAETVKILGICSSKSTLTAERFCVNGIFTAHAPVHGGAVEINGNLTTQSKLECDSITCSGLLTANDTVSADHIDIGGVVCAKEIFGDRVTIHPESFVSPRISHSKVDHIECTDLTASLCDFGEIWVQNVTLSGGCTVEKLYCDGELNLSPDCKVGKVYRMGEDSEFSASPIPVSDEKTEESAEATDSIDRKNEEIDSETFDLDDAFELDEVLECLNDELDNLDDELDDLDDDIEEIQDDLEDVNDRIDEIDEEIEELRQGSDRDALLDAEINRRNLETERRDIRIRLEEAQAIARFQRAELEKRRVELEQKKQELLDERARLEQSGDRKGSASRDHRTITVEVNGHKATVNVDKSLGESVQSVVKASMNIARDALRTALNSLDDFHDPKE